MVAKNPKQSVSIPLLEETLIIFKPEAVKRGVVFDILKRFARKGLWLKHFEKITASKPVLTEHYRDLVKEKPAIAQKVIDYMASSPVYVGVVEGINAINATIQLTGEKTDPNQCHPGTIRFDYSSDTYAAADSESRSLYNLIHRSDGIVSAKREVALWKKELEKNKAIEKYALPHSSNHTLSSRSFNNSLLTSLEYGFSVAIVVCLAILAIITLWIIVL